MRFDDFVEKTIVNCSECSRNRLNYPQKEEVCLHYGDNCTETSVNDFPNHCLLEEVNMNEFR